MDNYTFIENIKYKIEVAINRSNNKFLSDAVNYAIMIIDKYSSDFCFVWNVIELFNNTELLSSDLFSYDDKTRIVNTACNVISNSTNVHIGPLVKTCHNLAGLSDDHKTQIIKATCKIIAIANSLSPIDLVNYSFNFGKLSDDNTMLIACAICDRISK